MSFTVQSTCPLLHDATSTWLGLKVFWSVCDTVSMQHKTGRPLLHLAVNSSVATGILETEGGVCLKRAGGSKTTSDLHQQTETKTLG